MAHHSRVVQAPTTYQSIMVMAACLMLTFAMGSLHAFSALLEPIEHQTGQGRLSVSLIYSTGLFSLTVAVFLGHRLYRWLGSTSIALLCAILPIFGAGLTFTETWTGWISGYGLIFGFASGVGYGFALHACSCAMPATRRGVAIGAATAFYALGAFAFSFLYPALFDELGLAEGYLVGAILVGGLAIISALLFFLSQLKTNTSVDAPKATTGKSGRELAVLWFGYGMGAFAGLMVLGHAVPILQSSGSSSSLAITGLALVSLGNALAGLFAGSIADRFGSKSPLIVVAVISALALAGLVSVSNSIAALILIGLIGAMYGAFIALYPLLVSTWSGVDRSSWAYGRVFTAWGLAGVTAQPIAGWLFEKTTNYQAPLILACLMSFISAVTIAFVKQPQLSLLNQPTSTI